MNRSKLRNRVYLELSRDPSIYSPVEEFVIDNTANILDLKRGDMTDRAIRKAVKNDVVMTFGWLPYLIWAWRIARLISFIIDQYKQEAAMTVRARAEHSTQNGGDPKSGQS